MPFTGQEKTRLLYYLGYSLFEDDGPAMRAIHGLDSKEEVAGPIIRDLMASIEDVLCQVRKTIPLSMATKDGSIELRAHYTLDHLWRLGRAYVNRLGSFCKISVYSDIFSSGGRPRDPGSFYSGDPSEDRLDPNLGVPRR